ncbi:MAG: DUF1015 family protein [Blautia sp.]|nr:DUF1015 family protein [Blautia sp.]
MKIEACHRIVRTRNGLSVQQFINALKFHFEVVSMPPGFVCSPMEPHTFGMYLDGAWFHLKAYEDAYQNRNAFERLDVNILQKYVFEQILKITDPLEDERLYLMDNSVTIPEMQRIADRNQGILFTLFPITEDLIQEVTDAGFEIPIRTYCASGDQ